MKTTNNILRHLYILMLLILAGSMTSCVIWEENAFKGGAQDAAKEGYIRIYMSAPDLRGPFPKTRAMDNQAERTINQELLNILVFKYTDHGSGNISETFYYKAPVSGSISYDEDDENKAVITVRLVRSEDSNDLYRIVVIANYDMSSVSMVENVTTKQEILGNLIYDASGKWDADATGFTPFPMWGEMAPVVVSSDTPAQTVDLYRALSRIDVGLNFRAENGKMTDQADGVSNFKITELHVYRTYDKGYAAPQRVDFTTAPSIPATANRRGDGSPLSYYVPDTGGTNGYVREIYLPEADVPAAAANGNTHCIVMGGYYEGSPVATYYRLDFATETDLGVRTYIPVLRNHRYVFNITQVRGPGFETGDAALLSTGTIENLDYDLLVWDETIHEMEVQGKYYFGIDNRDLMFRSSATSVDPDNVHTISYQTNLPASETVNLSWQSVEDGSTQPPRFNAELAGNNTIRITANTDNITNTILEDKLIVRSGPFTMTVTVRQQYVNFKYQLVCTSVQVSGTYTNNMTLNPANNFITISIIAEDKSIQGRPYIIETVESYGVVFRAEGIFDFTGIPDGSPLQISDIKLAGNGILTASNGEEYLKLTIVSNSSNGSNCEATIPLAAPVQTIVVFGEISNLHGYAISRTQGGAGQVFASKNNFGPYEYSIVKTAGFTFVTTAVYDIHNYPNSEAYKWVTGSGGYKLADMVYMSWPAILYPAVANLLVQYMDKGGVVVAFLEDTSSSSRLANGLLNSSNITAAASGVAGSVYPFPAHDSFGLSPEAKAEVMRNYEGDPVLNGPFGDVRDKQWGEDATPTSHVIGLPADNPNLTIYSRYRDISTSGPSNNPNYVNGYKYESETRNAIWFGDGGFMSSGYSGTTGVPFASLTICPFYWNTTTMFPIPKPTYGWSTNQWSVYNSAAFCNIMAWAVQKSESLRSKRDSQP